MGLESLTGQCLSRMIRAIGMLMVMILLISMMIIPIMRVILITVYESCKRNAYDAAQLESAMSRSRSLVENIAPLWAVKESSASPL